MASILEKEWLNYFVQLNETEKKSVLQMLKAFLQTRGETYQRITVEQYNKELEEADKQIESGNFITHEEMEKEMEKW